MGARSRRTDARQPARSAVPERSARRRGGEWREPASWREISVQALVLCMALDNVVNRPGLGRWAWAVAALSLGGLVVAEVVQKLRSATEPVHDAPPAPGRETVHGLETAEPQPATTAEPEVVPTLPAPTRAAQAPVQPGRRRAGGRVQPRRGPVVPARILHLLWVPGQPERPAEPRATHRRTTGTAQAVRPRRRS